MNKLKTFLSITLLFFVFIYAIIGINQFYVAPNESEIKLMTSAYGDLKINNRKELIDLQNKIIKVCKVGLVSENKIELKNVLFKGMCYDRSLILQKIMIYNKISVRPIYFFYGGPTRTVLDVFFNKNLASHSAFEFKYDGKWYVMYTINEMHNLENINNYLNQKDPPFLKGETNYVRYLSNRNTRFISPNILPDIYFFNL